MRAVPREKTASEIATKALGDKDATGKGKGTITTERQPNLSGGAGLPERQRDLRGSGYAEPREEAVAADSVENVD